MADRYLVAGLGNPGKRYEKTRHNAGFMVMDRLAQQFQLAFKSGKGDYLISEVARTHSSAKEFVLLKPLTFMNNSGSAVRHALDYFKIERAQLLVVLDELQLPFAKLRLRPHGSDGGHNGLASVVQHLGSQDFVRLRLGIGGTWQGDTADYVLAPFTAVEQAELPELIDRAAAAVIDFIEHGVPATMNRFN